MDSLNINITERLSNTLYIPKSIFNIDRQKIEEVLSVDFIYALKAQTYFLSPKICIENSSYSLKRWNEIVHQELLNNNIPHNLSIYSHSDEFPHTIQNWLHWFNDMGEAKTEVYSRCIITDVNLTSDTYKEKLFNASIAVDRYKSSVAEFDRYTHTKPNQVALRDIYLGKKLLST